MNELAECLIEVFMENKELIKSILIEGNGSFHFGEGI